MRTLNEVKRKIEKLYGKGCAVHITVNTSRPRHTYTYTAHITGVYPNIFRFSEDQSSSAFHTVQYTDVLTEQVKISELDEI